MTPLNGSTLIAFTLKYTISQMIRLLISLVLNCFQPKPILIEKQYSEPNSPITKSFDTTIDQELQQQQQSQAQDTYDEQHHHSTQLQQQHQQIPHRRPPMHRGYSDLGNRIKKRVTLR